MNVFDVKKGTICTLFAFLQNVDLTDNKAICKHFEKMKITNIVSIDNRYNIYHLLL